MNIHAHKTFQVQRLLLVCPVLPCNIFVLSVFHCNHLPVSVCCFAVCLLFSVSTPKLCTVQHTCSCTVYQVHVTCVFFKVICTT